MGSRDILLEFWDISREQLRLETSNLAGRLDTGGPNEKMQNLVNKGMSRVT